MASFWRENQNVWIKTKSLRRAHGLELKPKYKLRFKVAQFFFPYLKEILVVQIL
jgi:hypothetical protein